MTCHDARSRATDSHVATPEDRRHLLKGLAWAFFLSVPLWTLIVWGLLA